MCKNALLFKNFLKMHIISYFLNRICVGARICTSDSIEMYLGFGERNSISYCRKDEEIPAIFCYSLVLAPVYLCTMYFVGPSAPFSLIFFFFLKACNYSSHQTKFTALKIYGFNFQQQVYKWTKKWLSTTIGLGVCYIQYMHYMYNVYIVLVLAPLLSLNMIMDQQTTRKCIAILGMIMTLKFKYIKIEHVLLFFTPRRDVVGEIFFLWQNHKFLLQILTRVKIMNNKIGKISEDLADGILSRHLPDFLSARPESDQVRRLIQLRGQAKWFLHS